MTGQELDDLRGLHFSNTNLIAKHLSGTKFSVRIPTNAALGICDCRVIGRYGISNPRPFVVGAVPEVRAATTNTSAEKAMSVPLNATINGQAVSEGVQFFKFSAKKGQNVLIECEGQDLDSRFMPFLTLLDASGRELAREPEAGTVLEVHPKADSEYLLKLHDFLFRGGTEYFYRLTLSTGPYIDYVLPPSAIPGTKAKFTIYGRNLPGGTAAAGVKVNGSTLEQLSVEIDVPKERDDGPCNSALLKPTATFVRGFEYRLPTPDGVSNPLFIGFAAAPVVSEQEPNNQPTKAQKIAVPCEIGGQLYPADDRDWFQFEAKKGDAFALEVISQRVGIQADPFVLIQRVSRNAKGEEEISDIQESYDSDSLGGNEFKTSSLDPAARFSAKEDGVYRIEVRDQFRGTDPRTVYRLAVRKEAPDYELVVLPQPGSPAKADSKEGSIVVQLLRRGQTIALKVLALRRDGFKGAIDLSIEGLPESISASQASIAETTNSTRLFLTASTNGVAWSGVFRVLGRSQSNELVRTARATTAIWNTGDTSVEPLQTRLTRDFALALSEEPAPIVIAAAEEKVFEGRVSGKLPIPLRVVRQPDFASALKLKPTGITGLDAKELDIESKATNATVQLDLQKAKAGEYDLVFQTQATGKYAKGSEKKDLTVNVYSAPIRVKITPAPVAAK